MSEPSLALPANSPQRQSNNPSLLRLFYLFPLKLSYLLSILIFRAKCGQPQPVYGDVNLVHVGILGVEDDSLGHVV
jgi:hypothetical protein